MMCLQSFLSAKSSLIPSVLVTGVTSLVIDEGERWSAPPSSPVARLPKEELVCCQVIMSLDVPSQPHSSGLYLQTHSWGRSNNLFVGALRCTNPGS